MVMMFVGGVLLIVDSSFHTIFTVGNLRGGSPSFPPEPIVVKLLTAVPLWLQMCSKFCLLTTIDS